MAANLEPGIDSRPTGSKLDLIQATVAAISRHGLSELTSAKIAGIAGHTAASINFHFGSKEALLLATLRGGGAGTAAGGQHPSSGPTRR